MTGRSTRGKTGSSRRPVTRTIKRHAKLGKISRRKIGSAVRSVTRERK